LEAVVHGSLQTEDPGSRFKEAWSGEETAPKHHTSKLLVISNPTPQCFARKKVKGSVKILK
jgi:hypothetical protein